MVLKKYFVLLFLSLAVASCEKTEEIVTPTEFNFAVRPEDTPFLNTSSITQANYEAIGNLDRGRELTGIDFAMVILKELPDDLTIEEFSAKLFEHWRIGGETEGKGVLFVISESDHTVKIEVAYELEDVFPDAFCGAYQETVRTYFAGRYFGDVVCRLIIDMVERYQGNDVDPALLLAGVIPNEASEKNFLSGGAGAVESRYFYDKQKKLSAILDASPELVAKYEAADTPEKTVELFIKSMEIGLNYPFLGILTEGSHYMRLEYPKTKYFLAKSAREFRGGTPMKIIEQGDLAVVRFASKGVMPILLRRRPDNKWVVDVTKTWGLIQCTSDLSEYYPLYRDNAWMFGFRDYSYKKSHVALPKLLDFPENLEEKIADLESRIEQNPKSADIRFELATLLYFECYWIRAAIDLVEEGLKYDPDNVPARWLAIQTRYRFPLVEGIPEHYEALLKLTPDDKSVWWGLHHFCKTYSKDKKRIQELEQGFRKKFGKKI